MSRVLCDCHLSKFAFDCINDRCVGIWVDMCDDVVINPPSDCALFLADYLICHAQIILAVLKPIPTNVSLKSFYHRIADFKHPYKALSSCIYRVCFLFL